MASSASPADVLGAIPGVKTFKHADIIQGPTTALVVIDLQNVFTLSGMPVEVPASRIIIPNVNRLARAVRVAGGKVVWVQMTLRGQENAWSVFFDGPSRAAVLAQMDPGSFGYQLHADLNVCKQDMIIQKTRYSAFIQGASDIDSKLRAQNIDTVIIAGALTNICCESSARDAMMLNYKVILVSDANATTSDAEHQASLRAIARAFGDVVNTDEAIAALTGLLGAP